MKKFQWWHQVWPSKARQLPQRTLGSAILVFSIGLAASLTVGCAQAASPAPKPQLRVVLANLRFEPNDLRVRAGAIVLLLVSPRSETEPHNLVIEDQAGNDLVESAPLFPGHSELLRIAQLAAGRYKILSSLGGMGYTAVSSQAEQGMVGTLTAVRPGIRLVQSSTEPAPPTHAEAVAVLLAHLRFTPGALRVRAGSAVFLLTVPAAESEPHNMVIQDAAGNVLTESADVPPGQQVLFSVDGLAPGTYKILSTLDGTGDSVTNVQSDSGMVGTLAVTG